MKEITHTPLTPDDREQFITDNQEAFNHGVLHEFSKRDDHFKEDNKIISRKTIDNYIDSGEAGRIKYDAKVVMELHRKTGCPVWECKNALIKTHDNIENAEIMLPKTNIAINDELHKMLETQYYYKDKLDSMISIIKNDCSFFGITKNLDEVLVQRFGHFNSDDYWFAYSEDYGYVLGSWERGRCNWSISSLDELGFRFLFLWSYVFHDFNPITQSQIEKAEKFMSDTFILYGDTQEYRKAKEGIRCMKDFLEKQQNTERH